MRADRAQATLLGLLVGVSVLTAVIIAGVSVSTGVIDQQTTMTGPATVATLAQPCVMTTDGACVDASIRRLRIEEQPHRVRLRAGTHWVGITPAGTGPITAIRLDGRRVLSDPTGLEGVHRFTVETGGVYTVSADARGGVIQLRTVAP